MCGIVAYTGKQPASPILLDGLRALEYRGYDSAGIYIPGAGTFKAVGPVQELANVLPGVLPGTAGIGHSRWATHGKPSLQNAHPHHDQKRRVWLVHNGIIENYSDLKKMLVGKGHTFESDTDSEVLAHLVGESYTTTSDLKTAVIDAVRMVRGTYGIAVMSEDRPDTVVTARMGSPIAIGIRDREYLLASDPAPILRHTNTVLYLEDGEYAVLSPKGYGVYSFNHEKLKRAPETLDTSLEDMQKSGHAHYMLKEVLEIPDVLKNSVRGRIVLEEGTAKLGGLIDHQEILRNVDRIIIVGCGSAFYAGKIGKLLIEDYAGIPAEVNLASEFRSRPIITGKRTAVLVISQSGETTDTLAAMREAKRFNLPTISIVNVVGSTIAREADMGVYNYAGAEVGMASTKAFVSQLEILVLIALFLGRLRGLSEAQGAEVALELQHLPEKVRSILARRNQLRHLAEEYLGYDDFLYIGRNYNLSTAFEGALKLKEVSYVHAEGYGAGEMKHGPIAMIDEIFPTIAIMPSDSTYEKMCSDVKDIRTRNGRVLAIATEGNKEIENLTDDVFYIPDTKEPLTPILASIPLQLFAYYTGVLRGFNVDRPRNLAQSITVE